MLAKNLNNAKYTLIQTDTFLTKLDNFAIDDALFNPSSLITGGSC
jgi:hypothetical protein